MPCWILPRGEAAVRAYVCLPIGDAAVLRSPVLEAEVDVGGKTELPEDLSLQDFVDWTGLHALDVEMLGAAETYRSLRVRFRFTLLTEWRFMYNFEVWGVYIFLTGVLGWLRHMPIFRERPGAHLNL